MKTRIPQSLHVLSSVYALCGTRCSMQRGLEGKWVRRQLIISLRRPTNSLSHSPHSLLALLCFTTLSFLHQPPRPQTTHIAYISLTQTRSIINF